LHQSLQSERTLSSTEKEQKRRKCSLHDCIDSMQSLVVTDPSKVRNCALRHLARQGFQMENQMYSYISSDVKSVARKLREEKIHVRCICCTNLLLQHIWIKGPLHLLNSNASTKCSIENN